MRKILVIVAGLALLVVFQNCGGLLSKPGTGADVTSQAAANYQLQQVGTAIARDFSSLAKILQSQMLGALALKSCENLTACFPAGAGTTHTYSSTCDGFSGTIGVSYSGASCSVLNSNQISITPELAIGSASSVVISSATHNDYRGISMGGGFDIDYSLASKTLSLAIAGLRYTEPSAYTDVSVRTTTAIAGTFNIPNQAIVLNGGNIELNDNSSAYTVSLIANAISFTSGCLCPTGGTLTGTFSGSFSGAATMTFTATCGGATVEGLGSLTTVSVPSCLP